MKWIIKLFLQRFCIWHAQRIVYWSAADRTVQLFYEAVESDITILYIKERINKILAIHTPHTKEPSIINHLSEMLKYQQDSIAKHYGLK